MQKRGIALLLLLTMLFVSGCSTSGLEQGIYVDESKPIVIFVSGVGLVKDGSFNAGIVKGLEKAVKDFNYDLKIIETQKIEDYEMNLKVAVEANPEMIIGVADSTEDMIRAAADYPKINFAVIDSLLDNSAATNVPRNFAALNFDNAEGAFLMGVIAAKANEKSLVEGFIGGENLPVTKAAEIGFKAGVKAANPGDRVLSSNVGSYTDITKATQLAAEQHSKDANVIFAFAGGANKGIIEDAGAKNYWVIGVDQDQALVYTQYTANILCSMVKNLDVAAYDVIKKQNEGHFESGIIHYGVENGGITLGNGGGNINDNLQATYDKWKKAIVDKSFDVPRTKQELEEFETPSL